MGLLSTIFPTRNDTRLGDLRYTNIPLVHPYPPAGFYQNPFNPGDRGDLVVHLSTFSKTVAPGLRVGWLAAPAPVVARLALAKQFFDLNTGALPQIALIGFLTAPATGPSIRKYGLEPG